MFNPHQRCGYSDSPFVKIVNFYTAGSGMELEGVDIRGPQGRLQGDTLRKGYYVAIKKNREDVKQGQKSLRICWDR